MKLLLRSGFIPLLILSASPCLFSQGFGGGVRGLGGMMKETVRLHRKLPAVFVLPGTNVSVKITTTAPAANALPVSMTPLVETTLQQNDNRIVIESSKPQVLISCVITGYIPPRIENLTHPGTPAGKNIFTGKQQAAQPGQPYKKVTGQLTVSYRALDLKNNKTLDAAVLDTKLNAEYDANSSKTNPGSWKIGFPKKNSSTDDNSSQQAGAEPASTEEVNQRMMKAIASDIARRAVTTDDTVEVLLARGKLESAAKLAQSGLWPRMLEQLESMPPFQQPEEDAYRLYDLGVAYEAMGYSAPDSKQGFKFFEEASVDYGKALDANPKEKYFREPQNRIQTALVIMKTLSERSNGIPAESSVNAETKKAGPEEGKPSEISKATVNGEPDVLTNDGISDLAKIGMNDENLIADINDAKQVNFDLTLAGQKQLIHAGISNTVLSAMRQRTKGSAVQKPASASRPKTSKAALHQQ